MVEITSGNNVLSRDELDLIHGALNVIDAEALNEEYENTGFALNVIRHIIPHPKQERPSPQSVNDALMDLHKTMNRVLNDY